MSQHIYWLDSWWFSISSSLRENFGTQEGFHPESLDNSISWKHPNVWYVLLHPSQYFYWPFISTLKTEIGVHLPSQNISSDFVSVTCWREIFTSSSKFLNMNSTGSVSIILIILTYSMWTLKFSFQITCKVEVTRKVRWGICWYVKFRVS